MRIVQLLESLTREETLSATNMNRPGSSALAHRFQRLSIPVFRCSIRRLIINKNKMHAHSSIAAKIAQSVWRPSPKCPWRTPPFGHSRGRRPLCRRPGAFVVPELSSDGFCAWFYVDVLCRSTLATTFRPSPNPQMGPGLMRSLFSCPPLHGHTI